MLKNFIKKKKKKLTKTLAANFPNIFFFFNYQLIRNLKINKNVFLFLIARNRNRFLNVLCGQRWRVRRPSISVAWAAAFVWLFDYFQINFDCFKW